MTFIDGLPSSAAPWRGSRGKTMIRRLVLLVIVLLISTNCRPVSVIPSLKQGIGVGWDVGTADEITTMSYWFYNWGMSEARLNVPGYVPMAGRSYIGDEDAADFAEAHPGLYWLLSNEPNNVSQDNELCDVAGENDAATANAIAATDPTARFLLGGIFSYGEYDNKDWLEYAECYLDAFDNDYTDSVLGWHIHIYHDWWLWYDHYDDIILDFETSLIEWREAFPTGELWLTEYGPLWAEWYGTPLYIVDYMEHTIEYMEGTNLVQRYAWFCLKEHDAGFEYAWLFDANGQMTVYGEEYATGINPEPLFGDLDGDCDVDVADIMLVAACWRQVGDCLEYDFNDDGAVNVIDIMLVVAHWGESCG